LAKYREVVGGAVDVMIGHGLPPAGAVEFEKTDERDRGDYLEFTGLLRSVAGRHDVPHGQELPTLFLQPKSTSAELNKQVVVWIDEAGKAGLYGTDGGLKPEIRKLLAAGATVAALDLLYQGEFLASGKAPVANRKVNTTRQYAGYTYGYNHPLFAQRVQDILSLVSFVKHHEHQPDRIDLIGLDGAGAWVAAASAQAGDAVRRAAIDTAGFRFAQLNDFADANFLPGSVKYGDLPGILALAAPRPLWLAGEGKQAPAIVRAAYAAVGKADMATVFSGGEDAEPMAAAEWLLK
jgi:hypothetical protein